MKRFSEAHPYRSTPRIQPRTALEAATASRHYFRAGEAVVALDNAYHDLVMAIACR